MITTIVFAISALWPAPLSQALEPMTDEPLVRFDLEVVSDDFHAVGAVRTGDTLTLTIMDSNVPDTEAWDRLMEDNGDDLEGQIWCDGFASQVPDYEFIALSPGETNLRLIYSRPGQEPGDTRTLQFRVIQ